VADLILYCPVCKLTRAIPQEQITPGPVYCGRCSFNNGGVKIQMQRDYKAEGLFTWQT
jgi:hypothetical protein